jgi:hypothetical protein
LSQPSQVIVGDAGQPTLDLDQRQPPRLKLFDGNELAKVARTVASTTAPTTDRTINQTNAGVPTDHPLIRKLTDTPVRSPGVATALRRIGEGEFHSAHQLVERPRRRVVCHRVVHDSILTSINDTVNTVVIHHRNKPHRR